MAHPVKGGAALVGPNTVIQIGAALADGPSGERRREVFRRAHLEQYLLRPPEAMIPESEARSLFLAVEGSFGKGEVAAIMRGAGLRTADYIAANRIPRPVRFLLAHLPKGIAARILLSAIARHAWTFAGSGNVACESGRPMRITIASNPLAIRGCVWHAAVFERLFTALLGIATHVRHPACCADGAPACRFEIDIGAAPSSPRREVNSQSSLGA